MNRSAHRRWLWALAALACVAVAMRVHNAFAYGVAWGFDSVFHWAYVRRLLIRGFHLPDPESGWSMSRPPLFFFASAAWLRAVGHSEVYPAFVAVRLASAAIGLAAIAAVVHFVRARAQGATGRWVIAALLLLFAPVHVYMSAMFNEEVLLGSLITAALVLAAWQVTAPRGGAWGWLRAAAIGVAAGLAAMTKLTGVIVAGPAALALAYDGWRRGGSALRAGLGHAALVAVLATVIGGWFYARNLWVHGYLWPYSLEVHSIMLDMQPGARGLVDYLYVPWATLFDARAIQPDLLRSVWGTTYATFWYDAQRHFVPPLHGNARTMGAVMLTLALVPTGAGAIGLARGARRIPRRDGALDLLMVSMVGATLAGYALYTWRNPWYATVKASYLLGLALPFGYYTSGVLAEWIGIGAGAEGPLEPARPGPESVSERRRRFLRLAVALACVALLVCAICAFTFETFLWDRLYGPVGFPNAPEVPKPLRQ